MLLFDGQGHGESTISLGDYTHGTAGYEAALEYGMSLPWVDETNVGITGHSWGARQVNSLTNHINANTSNHIKAVLYCGTGRGLDMDPQASQVYTGYIAAIFDEHLNNMAGNESYDLQTQRNARIQVDHLWPEFSADVVDPEWLAQRGGSAPRSFGEDAFVEFNVWYTSNGPVPFETTSLDVQPGSLIFFNPGTTHEGTVYNEESIGYFIQFWQATLGTPAGVDFMDSTHQITQVSKYFSFIALWTLFLMMFPLVNMVLNMDFFKKLQKSPTLTFGGPAFRSGAGQAQFWITNLIIAGFSLVSFFVLCRGSTDGAMYFPGNEKWPVTDANHFLLWTMAQGIFNILLYCLLNGIQEWQDKKAGREPAGMLRVLLSGSTLMDVFRSVLFAGILLFAFWTVVRIGWEGFHSAIRFSLSPSWFMPVVLRPYPDARLLLLPRYLPFFVIAWLPTTLGLAGTNYRDLPEWVQSLITGVVNILPIIAIVAYEYIGFFTAKHNVSNYDVYWLGSQLKSFIIPLFLIAILTRYIYRKTKNVWVPAAFNIIFIELLTLSSLIMYWDAIII